MPLSCNVRKIFTYLLVPPPMKKLKWLFLFLSIATAIAVLAYLTIFSISSTAKLNVNQENTQKHDLKCYNNDNAHPIDHKGELNILVWNIFKQSEPNWREALEQYSKDIRLALLQEVSMTEEFKAYTQKSTWFSSHVDAFSVFGMSTGVLTLSIQSPRIACAYIELEPWLQLPKSGIYSIYKLSDQRELAVVNLHSVNFTYGIEEYEKQIKVLVEALKKHQGPIIFAGDLNAWSLERITTIKNTLKELALIEVKFNPDNRKQFMNGMALDYVFYRDLEVINSTSPITNASDHNPLQVKFRL